MVLPDISLWKAVLLCQEVHNPVMKTAIQRIPKLAGMAAVMRGTDLIRFFQEANSRQVIRKT